MFPVFTFVLDTDNGTDHHLRQRLERKMNDMECLFNTCNFSVLFDFCFFCLVGWFGSLDTEPILVNFNCLLDTAMSLLEGKL